ncbi:hypothetical protein B9Z19DRAFT_1130182 [Tuber borchii]|uniref:Uncharacterized protein n=1 Tax=Tuber borchii TaxID=42251 RepID=A0A2T6ZKX2_TUBBO|nr:hypothetical protein B9Z19DRAFT_1130182 [Tuber borchii]
MWPGSRNKARPEELDWPTIVVESGVSQTLNSLCNAAQRWLSNSGGDSKNVILIDVTKAERKLHLELWEDAAAQPKYELRGYTTEETACSGPAPAAASDAAPESVPEPLSESSAVSATEAPPDPTTDPPTEPPPDPQAQSPGEPSADPPPVSTTEPSCETPPSPFEKEKDIVYTQAELEAYGTCVWNYAS